MCDATVRNSGTSRTATGTPVAARPEPHPGSSPQDRELLLLDAEDTTHLRGRVAYLAELTGRLASAEFGALTGTLQRSLAGRAVRAAVVAASPEQASERCARLLAMLDDGARAAVDLTGGVFLGEGDGLPSIGYLFPGQGSGKGDDGGALARRFETVRDLYRTVTLPACEDPAATIVAQPRITMSSVAGLRVLSLLGIEAAAAVGHSLGELTALHWAGAMTESELFALAAACGRVMMEASEGGGAMSGIGAGPEEGEPLLGGEPVVIAGYNGPAQTVISRLTQLGCVIALHPSRGESAIFESRRLSSPVSWLSPGLAVVSSRSPRLALGFMMCMLAVAVFTRLDGAACALCSVCAALSFAANFSFAFVDAFALLAILIWACARTQATRPE